MTQETRRVTLTKLQLSTNAGRALRDLLGNIAEDGALTDAEISELGRWLNAARADFPAIGHLQETLADVLRDGIVTDAERRIVLRQIERVLPKEDREEVQFARRALVELSHVESELDPTDAQLRYIAGLGGKISKDASRDDASAIIDTLLNSNASITPRQWMVVRFWGKTVQPEWGRKHVSEWMDEWYQDPARQAAWELFKEETGDYGGARDPKRVPIGIGAKYYARVKGAAPRSKGESIALSKPPGESSSLIGVAAVIVVVVIIAFFAIFTMNLR